MIAVGEETIVKGPIGLADMEDESGALVESAMREMRAAARFMSATTDDLVHHLEWTRVATEIPTMSLSSQDDLRESL